MARAINEVTHDVIKSAIEVHNELGPGLLESAYQPCMEFELRELGYEVRSELSVPVVYKGKRLEVEGYRLDILVADTVVVELKSVEEVKPVHKKQLLTYLRLTGKRFGLLINFNEELVKDGITRVAN